MNTLSKIQSEIKAPKGQFNSFGKYKYRSCEDIVEAVKPVINPLGFSLTLSDEIVNIGERFYIKATALITNGEETYSATAYAREEENKKGMDASQLTGATSSYARKYALNGLFAIDDTKDADATNTHDKTESVKEAIESIDDDDLKILKNLVYTADLTDVERSRAFDGIHNLKNYKAYQKALNYLQDKQPSIDTIPNPNQTDINKHLKKVIPNA